MTTAVPAGFEPHFRKSPFTDPWEPLYSMRTDRAVIMGLRLAKPHTNARGLIHGGLIASLADNAMGYSCGQVARLGAARLFDRRHSSVSALLAVRQFAQTCAGNFSESHRALRAHDGPVRGAEDDRGRDHNWV